MLEYVSLRLVNHLNICFHIMKSAISFCASFSERNCFFYLLDQLHMYVYQLTLS